VTQWQTFRRWPASEGLLGVVMLALVHGWAVRVAAESATTARAKQLAAAAYAATGVAYRTASTNGEAAWQFGRACFDWAEFATNDTQRADLAEQGIAVCRRLVAREPKSAPAHYYLAMNLGQLARTKSLGGLKIASELESELKATRDLDEKLNHAGPDRCLGLLYLNAPGWPVSVGSRSKARKHLQRATELAPDYPDNRLNLFEACVRWSDWNGARNELKALETLWPAARTNFTGEAWAKNRADWERRLERGRLKIGQAAKPIESPRNKE